MEHLARWFINSGICGVHQTSPIHWHLDGRVQHRLDDRSKSCSAEPPCHWTLVEPSLVAVCLCVEIHVGRHGCVRGVCVFVEICATATVCTNDDREIRIRSRK